MKRQLLSIFLFISFSANAQDVTDTIALKKIFYGNSPVNEKTIASRKLARYFSRNNPVKALEWAKLGMPFAKKATADSLLWKQYSILAETQDDAGYPYEAVETLNEAIPLQLKKGNKDWLAVNYNDLAATYGNKLGDYPKATENFIKAQKIYEEMGMGNDAMQVEMNLGVMYANQKLYKKAKENFRRCIQYFQQSGELPFLTTAYGSLAICHLEMGAIDSSYYYSDKQLQVARQSGEDYRVAKAWNYRSQIAEQSGNTTEFIRANDSLLFYVEKTGSSPLAMHAYTNLGRVSSKAGEYTKASQYMQKSLSMARDMDDKVYTVTALNDLAALHQDMGNYQQAYKLEREAYLLRDSFFTNEAQKNIADMQVHYATEKKEARIALLDNQNKLQRRSSWFLISGLSLLAIIGFILYRNNRIKQNINKKLQLLNHSLDEANQSKAKLFSILSHDLRSPVSDLFTFLELQKMAPDLLDEEMKKVKQEQLYHSTDHLLNTMTDVLLWSKSQQQTFIPDKTDVSIKKLIENTLNIYGGPIADKQLTIKVATEDHVVHTDENILKTIVRNLINNAVKFTPTGGAIRFVMTRDSGKLQLQVINSGEPIPPDAAKQLFNWSAMNSDNHGYGLKLASELAERLNIKIGAASGAMGNVFTLTF